MPNFWFFIFIYYFSLFVNKILKRLKNFLIFERDSFHPWTKGYSILGTNATQNWNLFSNFGESLPSHKLQSAQTHMGDFANPHEDLRIATLKTELPSPWRRGVLQHIVDLKSTSPILVLLPVIPAQAGIQFFSLASWIPVFTGITILMFHYSDAHGRPQSNPMRDRSPRIGRPFCKVFTSPQGEGFRPSPKVTLNEVKVPKLSTGLEKGQFLTSD